MAIEIVDLPIKHGGSFHSYGTVYQRVKDVKGIPKTWSMKGVADAPVASEKSLAGGVQCICAEAEGP